MCQQYVAKSVAAVPGRAIYVQPVHCFLVPTRHTTSSIYAAVAQKGCACVPVRAVPAIYAPVYDISTRPGPQPHQRPHDSSPMTHPHDSFLSCSPRFDVGHVGSQAAGKCSRSLTRAHAFDKGTMAPATASSHKCVHMCTLVLAPSHALTLSVLSFVKGDSCPMTNPAISRPPG